MKAYPKHVTDFNTNYHNLPFIDFITNHYKLAYWFRYKPVQSCLFTPITNFVYWVLQTYLLTPTTSMFTDFHYKPVQTCLLTLLQTITNLFIDFIANHYKLVYWLHYKPLQTLLTHYKPFLFMNLVSFLLVNVLTALTDVCLEPNNVCSHSTNRPLHSWIFKSFCQCINGIN